MRGRAGALFGMRAPTKREIWIVSTLLAAILVWSGRFVVNPDGISYLDLSDDIRAGRFMNAVNLHWSPGYPYLLACWLSPLSPGSPLESTGVHILNGILFLGALAAFELFLKELEKSQGNNKRLAVPLNTAWGRFAAYTIFLWCALVLITIRTITPDMLVALFGFIAAGLFVRIRSDRAGTGSFVAFGVMLGLAALSKSFMFPVAIVMIALSAIRRRPYTRHLLALAAFVIVTAPHVAALSHKSGRLTIGESGRLVYLLKVNGIPKLREGIVYFPTDKANRTYPAWDDPTILYKGMSPDINATDQAAALKRNLVILAGFALKVLGPLLIVVAFKDRKVQMRNRALAATAAAVMVVYLLLHTETRLDGFWVALLIVSVLAGVTLDPREMKFKIGRGFVHVITIVSVISFVTFVLDQAGSSRPDRGLAGRNTQATVAREIERMGITRGSRIALVGDESDIYWARLAGVQIAAQIPLRAAKSYEALPEPARNQVHEQFRAVGARAVVASWTPSPADS
ncbi:MAG TPA: hypothetical protein VJL35_00690, partial [Gemmatimonadaceae bacterium]|nr:hypothetical protein [Gemmatimonadaceae bacterium]